MRAVGRILDGCAATFSRRIRPTVLHPLRRALATAAPSGNVANAEIVGEENVGFPANVTIDIHTQSLIESTETEKVLLSQMATQVLPKELPVYSFADGVETGEMIQLDPRVFHVPLRVDILHRVVVWQEKNARTTLYKAKDRSEVRGGGAKPWNQKGTGRARAGSIRSPIWVGGGTAHGPVFRDWSTKLPKKIRRLGVRVALSSKLRDQRLTIVDSIDSLSPPQKQSSSSETTPVEEGQQQQQEAAPAATAKTIVKTKQVAQALAKLGNSANTPVLLVGGLSVAHNARRAAANLPRVNLIRAVGTNVYDILKADRVVLTKEAVAYLTEHLTQDY